MCWGYEKACRAGARLVFDKLSEATRTALKRIWADGGYRGQLVDWYISIWTRSWRLSSATRRLSTFRSFHDDGLSSAPLPGYRYRRLSKDYEHCTRSSEGVFYIASIHTMMKRLTNA